MSEHDPLCLLYPRSEGRSRGFCVCEVIQQARNEVLSGETALASESYDLGYEQGQRDMLARCLAAVEASAADLTAWDYDAERALAALRALAADPCACDDCRAAVEHLADLEIDRMREES